VDRRLQQLIDAELARWPGVTSRPEEGSKHVKLFLLYQGRSRFVTCQKTAGGGRGMRNTVADVRRTLQALGATRLR